jgi:hypothetical protein
VILARSHDTWRKKLRRLSGIVELVEHGQLDLVLHIDDGLLPSHFQSERLYREDWICAVARGSRFGDRLSLKQYLAASHIVVSTYAGVQTIPDKQLAAVSAKRSSWIRIPYFGVALQCLPGTELVLTVTSGLRSVVEGNRELRVVKAPQELRVLLLNGLASEAQQRSASCLASRGNAINNDGPQLLSQGHRRAHWVVGPPRLGWCRRPLYSSLAVECAA